MLITSTAQCVVPVSPIGTNSPPFARERHPRWRGANAIHCAGQGRALDVDDFTERDARATRIPLGPRPRVKRG